MYGFKTWEEAEQKRAVLAVRYPENKYEVAIHKHPERSFWGHKRDDLTTTYGVKRYVQYIPSWPWKFDGFVWF